MRSRTGAVATGRGVASLALAICVTGTWGTVSQAGQAGARSQPPCPSEPALFHPCALAQSRAFAPHRTPEGTPDFQGFWRGPGSGTENIQEHPETLDDNGGKSLIVDPRDGIVPYRAWAATRPRENRDKYVEPNVPCFLSGVPRSLYVPTHIEILQPPGYVLMLFERSHAYRIIPTAPRPPVGKRIGLWQGDSRGRWEENTLVVEVTNQNARPWLDQAGNFYSSAAHMVERFTLVDADTLHYEVTIDDPDVYTRPWTMAFPLRRNSESGFRLIEEACHEGERNTQPLINLGYRIYTGPPPAP